MKLKNESSGKSIRRALSIDVNVNNDLDLYSQAINSSPNWIVNQILFKFFAKDKEFLEWKKNRLIAPSVSDNDSSLEDSSVKFKVG